VRPDKNAGRLLFAEVMLFWPLSAILASRLVTELAVVMFVRVVVLVFPRNPDEQGRSPRKSISQAPCWLPELDSNQRHSD